VAETQAMTMEQAMGFYVNNLVTKDYLDARFEAFEAKFDKRSGEQDAKFEKRFNKSESDMRVLKWGQAILIGAVVLPQLAKLAV
jgi:hypothetical protein